MAKTELVDDSTFYGTVAGVETYIRNKDFSTSTDLSTGEVETKLLAASEWIDSFTRRAWRTRRVTDRTLRVDISRKQERWYEKGRRSMSPYRGRTQVLAPVDPWALVKLRYYDIETVTKVEVLLPREVTDITSDQGRSDGEWHVETTDGKLYVDISNFAAGPTRGGGVVPNPKVNVSFDYGMATSALPDDVADAAERLVAADLINTDSYGAVLGNGPENVPDMTTGASELFSGAMTKLTPYRGMGTVL